MIHKDVSLRTFTLSFCCFVLFMSLSTFCLARVEAISEADANDPVGQRIVAIEYISDGIGIDDFIENTDKTEISRSHFFPIDPVYFAGIEPRKVVDSTPRYVVEQTGGIKVTTLPGGAEVKIDDRPAGHTPVILKGLKPGKVKVRVSKDGYEIEEKIANIDPDRTLEVKIELVPSASDGKGRLTVHPSPGNSVIRILNINPRYQPGIALKPGKYQVEVSAPGYITRQQWVNLALGDNLQLVMSLDKEMEVVSVQPSQKRSPPKAKTSVAVGDTIKDTNTRLMWTVKDNGRDITWSSAVSYCNSLNLAGYRNWRLPSIKELERLLRDNTALANRLNLSGTNFWSSTDKNRTAKQYNKKKDRAASSRKTNSFGIRALAVRNYR